MEKEQEPWLDIDPQEVCFYCLRRLADRVSCTTASVTVSGVTYGRVAFGRETLDLWARFYDAADAAAAGVGTVPLPLCPLCAVPVGALHHPGCEYEECPRCGWYLGECRCGPEPFALAGPATLSPPQLRLPL